MQVSHSCPGSSAGLKLIGLISDLLTSYGPQLVEESTEL